MRWWLLALLAVPNAPADFRLIESCEEVPRPEFEAELVSHFCPDSDTRRYFTETRQASSAFPRCWKVVVDQVSGCEVAENYWTPQPGDYVPPVDEYVQVAPEPEVPSGG